MNMYLTAIILALIAMLANGEYFLGSSMLSRPLVTCTLTGLVMGNLTEGIIIGASLELALLVHLQLVLQFLQKLFQVVFLVLHLQLVQVKVRPLH